MKFDHPPTCRCWCCRVFSASALLMVLLAVAGFILAGTGTGCVVGAGHPASGPDSAAVADSMWYADSTRDDWNEPK